MDKNKYVTYEILEQYHKRLMEYIGIHDDLILHGYTFCPKCGEVMMTDKCNKCNTKLKE